MKTERFLTPAREEFLEAIAHYELQSPGLGREFLDEVEQAVTRIIAFPGHGSPHLGGTRRVVLARFPFHVVYLAERSGILVIAVAHHKRSPGYWRKRI